MYRPDNWKNDYRRAADACSRLGNMHDGVRANSEAVAYEIGADAMLEGLRANAVKWTHEATKDGKPIGLNSKLVFIPEEE